VEKLGPHRDVVCVSVEYALAPEHRFPAAPDDALEALKTLVVEGRGLRGRPLAHVAVAGASAGATLALTTAYRASLEKIRVDSMYVDALFVKDGACGGAVPGPGEGSYARNGWTRLPAVAWLEWSWHLSRAARIDSSARVEEYLWGCF